MKVTITPAPLSGTVTPPGSKSQTHRLVLAAALAEGESVITGAALSRDIQATLDCAAALGAAARWSAPGELTITGRGNAPLSHRPTFDCGESGSTLRFLLPVALAAAGGGRFVGQGRLMERPLAPYRDLLEPMGVSWQQEGNTLTVEGQLLPGGYTLPGNVSSQFFTGLLFALPLLSAPSTLAPTGGLESADYLTMTLEALHLAGVDALRQGDGFSLSPSPYRPFRAQVEGDWSQAAFWYAANFLGSSLTLSALRPDSPQGDRRIFQLYWQLARPGDTEVDLSPCPDLAPPLALMAAVRRGRTRFVRAGRLRLKESDRLSSIAATLSALGAQVEEGTDTLTVHGQEQLPGGVSLPCHGDHRIAMMAAVAATACRAPVTLEGAECVDKSYPTFFEEFQRLGGMLHVL